MGKCKAWKVNGLHRYWLASLGVKRRGVTVDLKTLAQAIVLEMYGNLDLKKLCLDHMPSMK